MSQAIDDIRYGVRSLFRNPGLSVIALSCLALGIGANSAIFSMVNSLLRGRLPFRAPDQLVMVWERNLSRGWPRFPASPANYMDWLDQDDVFESMAGYVGGFETLTGRGEAARLPVTYTWAGLLSVLRTTPLLGRGFVPEENQPGNDNVVILSHRLWENVFGADSTIVVPDR